MTSLFLILITAYQCDPNAVQFLFNLLAQFSTVVFLPAIRSIAVSHYHHSHTHSLYRYFIVSLRTCLSFCLFHFPFPQIHVLQKSLVLFISFQNLLLTLLFAFPSLIIFHTSTPYVVLNSHNFPSSCDNHS